MGTYISLLVPNFGRNPIIVYKPNELRLNR